MVEVNENSPVVAIVSGGGRERSNTINKTEIEIFLQLTTLISIKSMLQDKRERKLT